MYLPLAATGLYTIVMATFHAVRHQNNVRDEEKQAPTSVVKNKKDINVFSITVTVSLVFMALSAGLSSRMDASTPLATVIGLQVLFSVASSLGSYQIRNCGVRWSTFGLCKDEQESDKMPDLQVLAIFLETIGGSLGINAAQAILSSLLAKQIPKNGSDLSLIWAGGPTNFRDKLSGDALKKALDIWNGALTSTFYVPTAAGALSLVICLPSLMLWWRQRRRGLELIFMNPPAITSRPMLIVPGR
jgi:hypothetical protein